MSPYATWIIWLGVLSALVLAGSVLWSNRQALTARLLVRLYLFLGSFVTLVAFALGLATLLTGLFAMAAIDFSYAMPPLYANTPVNSPEPAVSLPNESDATRRAQQAMQEQLQIQERRAQARQQAIDAQKLRDERNRQRDKQATDLIQGATFAVLGAALFLLHGMVRRRLDRGADTGDILGRGWLMASLVTFGVTGLIALPAGVYETLKFFIVRPLPINTPVAPGSALSFAVVLTPLWVAFLLLLLRQARANGRTNVPADSLNGE